MFKIRITPNQRYEENVAKNCSKLPQIQRRNHLCWSRQNYANAQAFLKIYQLFISKLSTVIHSPNQNLIPGADIMEWQQQWNVYRLSCALTRRQTALGLSPSG